MESGENGSVKVVVSGNEHVNKVGVTSNKLVNKSGRKHGGDMTKFRIKKVYSDPCTTCCTQIWRCISYALEMAWCRMRRPIRKQLLYTGILLVTTSVVVQFLNYSNASVHDNLVGISKEVSVGLGITKDWKTKPSTEDDGWKARISNFDKFQINPSIPMQINQREALLFGNFRNYTSYLTIGIPTVQREGVDYLEDTINSLIKNTQVKERKEVIILVFLVDQEHDKVTQRAKKLYEAYREHVDSGFIQLVHPDHQYYPDFSKLHRNFNDSEARVAWRSKQNIDYAYMFLYSKNLSQYYMQIEDDVLTAKSYLSQVKRFVKSRPSKIKWFCIQFSHLGFIGKMFRAEDLQSIAEFLLMFYSEQPGDLLINYMKKIKTQFKDILMKPSLFQHRGVISSLKDKKQFLVDKSFRDRTSTDRKKFYQKNPPADIFSSIEVYDNLKPEYAYDLSNKYFWGLSPSLGDYYRISFHKPVNISRIYVDSGYPKNPKDILCNAALKISRVSDSSQLTQEACDNREMFGTFNRTGDFDTIAQNSSMPIYNVGCISIELTKAQKEWVIIREIAIFTVT
ncbi:alpha-1,3-mannosyl-glycoprotein 4-beta-N-acetylglucosaminyltransferase C-like isoform X1 [Mizuhopecten yessoensis]|uniref:alpha-1,3-mannosyl-glycoprotein 4-beta-N-acetylglucosaminyltransferase C-like isoform X1 n=2 Tax=Mizuhopecten yessoensis TaxID=6573 RepID=UPI000B45F42B|nr:alpha-1,3-mannosyl-glycoprotein 4-beta-N-acetylglucosaminyltransferase C-like isoform X1 [Mizuhopecten yessoensis]